MKLKCIIHGYETVRQFFKKTKISRGFEQAAMVGPLPLGDCSEGFWEEPTLASLARASCAFANFSIHAIIPAHTSASFSRLQDPGEQMGLFLEIKMYLDLVLSLTPIRNYQAEYGTAVTYNLPTSHSANSHSLCY